MTLHPCRECRHAVSTEAQACPRCGAVHPAGVSAGAPLLTGAGLRPAAPVGDGPTPEFWRATRLLFRRVRVGFYGIASAVFAAMLTGSFLLKPAPWAFAAGGLFALVLCLAAMLIELLDLQLGKGGSHDH